MPDSEKQSLCGELVTLDGARAGICGWRNRFATVRRMDGTGGAVEFAWETVAHVVANGGRFTS